MPRGHKDPGTIAAEIRKSASPATARCDSTGANLQRRASSWIGAYCVTSSSPSSTPSTLHRFGWSWMGVPWPGAHASTRTV